MTPIVSDIQLLPGRWKRPNAPFVSHPLYAGDISEGSSIVPTPEESGTSGTRDESSSIPFGKRRKSGSELALSGTRK